MGEGEDVMVGGEGEGGGEEEKSEEGSDFAREQEKLMETDQK